MQWDGRFEFARSYFECKAWCVSDTSVNVCRRSTYVLLSISYSNRYWSRIQRATYSRLFQALFSIGLKKLGFPLKQICLFQPKKVRTAFGVLSENAKIPQQSRDKTTGHSRTVKSGRVSAATLVMHPADISGTIVMPTFPANASTTRLYGNIMLCIQPTCICETWPLIASNESLTFFFNIWINYAIQWNFVFIFIDCIMNRSKNKTWRPKRKRNFMLILQLYEFHTNDAIIILRTCKSKNKFARNFLLSEIIPLPATKWEVVSHSHSRHVLWMHSGVIDRYSSPELNPRSVSQLLNDKTSHVYINS